MMSSGTPENVTSSLNDAAIDPLLKESLKRDDKFASLGGSFKRLAPVSVRFSQVQCLLLIWPKRVRQCRATLAFKMQLGHP